MLDRFHPIEQRKRGFGDGLQRFTSRIRQEMQMQSRGQNLSPLCITGGNATGMNAWQLATRNSGHGQHNSSTALVPKREGFPGLWTMGVGGATRPDP